MDLYVPDFPKRPKKKYLHPITLWSKTACLDVFLRRKTKEEGQL